MFGNTILPKLTPPIGNFSSSEEQLFPVGRQELFINSSVLLLCINKCGFPSFRDMTHSQMLGKIEYTLPAKF